jgi:hypothetical protein
LISNLHKEDLVAIYLGLKDVEGRIEIVSQYIELFGRLYLGGSDQSCDQDEGQSDAHRESKDTMKTANSQ